MRRGEETRQKIPVEADTLAIDPQHDGFYGHDHYSFGVANNRLSFQYVPHQSGNLLLIAPTDKLNQFNWIVNSFTLASTSSVLCYGQISDVFGRHSVIQAAILFVLIGSVLGAGAQAWPMLLLGRGFQGLGFSGLGVVTRLILSDKVSLRENAKNNTLFNLLNGIAMGVGPVVGGYLTKVRSFIIVLQRLS
jgi:MFS family permease